MTTPADPTRTGRRFTPLQHARDDDPPGLLTRWMERSRGWPAAVPIRKDLRKRMRFELSRTSVGLDLQERMKRAGVGPIGAAAAWAGLVGSAPSLLQITIQLTKPPPEVAAVLVLATIAIAIFAMRRVLLRITGPRTRAGLRREGIDCCIRCGHLMATGQPAAICPECGLDHEALPLEWGPGPLRPLAADARHRAAVTAANAAGASDDPGASGDDRAAVTAARHH